MSLGLSIFINTLVLLTCTAINYTSQSNTNENKFTGQPHGCFCKLEGEVDDCSCKVESVDSFNNHKIFPRLRSLLAKDYFRYFKVNLDRPCPFWADDSRCSLRDCHVDQCEEDEVPDGLKAKEPSTAKYTENTQQTSCETDEEENKELGSLDRTISKKSEEAFKSWKEHDDAQDLFCELDDINSNGVRYVDLLLNPERYTGYKGVSAHRIWNSIYKENCFTLDHRDFVGYISKGSKADMCLEKRVFYRMVSGLHTSINIHLSAMYLNPAQNAWGASTWGPNVKEFKARFDPETTNGAGPQRLKNLYFTYLVELRALAKVAPYLEEEIFYTGNEKVDEDVRSAVKDVLDMIKSFPHHFDESQLFSGDPKIAAELTDEFKLHFRNISRIMDCVGCVKCRLWGKLQIQGMGTALKILFSGKDIGPESTLNAKHKSQFQLQRSEIVALLNGFGRLSKSINEIELFRKLLR